jgi:metal-dependent amidase/aminoacylase/carboxypeptidase family protein
MQDAGSLGRLRPMEADLVALRRDLHAHPETAFADPRLR